MLIVYGADREEAFARGRRALEGYRPEGIKTTISPCLRLLDGAFLSGEYHTGYLEGPFGKKDRTRRNGFTRPGLRR